jgi:hypothetical protein
MEHLENSMMEINRYDIHNDNTPDNVEDGFFRACTANALEHSLKRLHAMLRLATTLQIDIGKYRPRKGKSAVAGLPILENGAIMILMSF